MMFRNVLLVLSAAALAALASGTPAASGAPAAAGGYSRSAVPTGAVCDGAAAYAGRPIIGGGMNAERPSVTKNFDLSHNIQINKSFDFTRNITINKSFDLSKTIDLSRSIVIQKNIDLSKNIVINRNIDLGLQTQSFVFGQSMQQQQPAFLWRGGGSTIVNVVQGSDLSTMELAPPCVEQDAQLVKAIHAECIDARGNVHPAARMRPETWIDSSLEEEIFRCLPGSTVRAVIGDVVQSDRGMAGIYEEGKVLACAPGEALRHYQDGLVNCATAVTLTDCAEREYLRRNGLGDIFFSYRARVCAAPAGMVRRQSFTPGLEEMVFGEPGAALEVGLDGGVGTQPY